MMSKVAFQGEHGAYSEMAAINYFDDLDLYPLKSLQDVFYGVENNTYDYAVVPVENSIEGSVNETYDLLFDAHLYVCGEIYQRINHCLISNINGDGNIECVYSHPQALAQCRGYLNKKGIQSLPLYDTAGAVKYIKEKKILNAAAIASKRAAEIYHMKILEESIEDKKNNYTRFLILSKNTDNNLSNSKTSIIFSIRHIPGSLFGILEEFAKRQINLTRIESRPTKEHPWEYNFFLDFEGNLMTPDVNELIDLLKLKTSFIKILGSYNRGIYV